MAPEEHEPVHVHQTKADLRKDTWSQFGKAGLILGLMGGLLYSTRNCSMTPSPDLATVTHPGGRLTKTPEQLRQFLKIGMTEEQVLALLGQPTDLGVAKALGYRSHYYGQDQFSYNGQRPGEVLLLTFDYKNLERADYKAGRGSSKDFNMH